MTKVINLNEAFDVVKTAYDKLKEQDERGLLFILPTKHKEIYAKVATIYRKALKHRDIDSESSNVIVSKIYDNMLFNYDDKTVTLTY